MKSSGTHFEQVPKAIVEKILAKQIAVKPAVRQAEALAPRLRKV